MLTLSIITFYTNLILVVCSATGRAENSGNVIELKFESRSRDLKISNVAKNATEEFRAILKINTTLTEDKMRTKGR